MDNTVTSDAIVIGLVAGEPSGDILGAGLMAAIKDRLSGTTVQFIGVGGPLMLAEGLQALADFEDLAVNGFREPILRLPSLYRLFRGLLKTFVQRDVDAFVGIDFNVFNFLLEGRLKLRGIPTAHYVSPSVYAWRTGRTKRVARCADKLFCLFPFEPALYRHYCIDAQFVGHPMAAQIAPDAGAPAARARAKADLGLQADRLSLALLPGSRGSEVELMLKPMLKAASLFAEALKTRGETLEVIVPCLSEARSTQIAKISQDHADVDLLLHRGDARRPLIACDLALVKSGTSTLEAMLVKRPMVVTYRLGYWTFLIANSLLKTPYIAVPNILAGRLLVPELVQDAATPEAMSQALLEELDKSREAADYMATFASLHQELAAGASGLGPSAGAALGVEDLLQQNRQRRKNT